jgi:hypothetical protein
VCSCLFEAQKPFGPFLDALISGSNFSAAPSAVASAIGPAAPPETFSPDPEPGQYDDEDDYRYTVDVLSLSWSFKHLWILKI